MNQIRITKEFRFEAAHALTGHDGLCKNIHGHSYLLSVTVAGIPVTDPASAKLGMVMDFGDLKKLVREHIVNPIDHALLLHEQSPLAFLRQAEGPCENIILLPYQPTSENLLLDFAKKIGSLLPDGIRLHSMRLRETETSYAEWFADDN